MDHPGIVPIHDFGRHEDFLFFVMPVVQGTNLREVLREGSLTLGELLDIGAPGSRKRWTTATSAAWCTATSSPRMSWSPGKGAACASA